MKDLTEKIQDLEHALAFHDFNEYEDTFINSIVGQMKARSWNTTTLSGKQVDVIDRLWEKHCS